MSKELNRMQELAGVPVNEEKESLNEHQIGGVVGIGAIHTPKREKSDYEMAFEHFMTEGEEKEEKEVKEGMYEEDDVKESYYEEDDTMEEAVGIPVSAEALKLEILKIMNSHRSDSDLGAAIRKKFTPTFDSQDSYSANRPTTMKDREEETRRRFAQKGMGAI